MIVSVLLWFKQGFSSLVLAMSLVGVLTLFTSWFRDLERERGYQGNHTLLIQSSLKWGLIWFLFREVWFFFRVFWTFFHVRISPITRGSWDWPTEGLTIIPPFQVPLLNTVILLIRGVTATLAHHELLANRDSNWIEVRVVLGSYFLLLQGFEYATSYYSISRGAYGRIFFFGTGFHGMHVCLGAIMLTVRAIRLKKNLLTSQHHFGLEFSLWYWHFVDIVWLFLFFWVYTWGS
jgi:heme/copper-type cytochrome/quinol oxidase subunit 3